MKKENRLYILSNGRVAAINKKDGSIAWEVKLKDYGAGNMSTAIGQIMVEEDKLYVGVGGVLLCLAAKDGSLLWKNELKGWGYHFISLANVNNDAAGAAALQASASQAAATSGAVAASAG